MPGAEEYDVMGFELVEDVGLRVMGKVVISCAGSLWKYEKGGDVK